MSDGLRLCDLAASEANQDVDASIAAALGAHDSWVTAHREQGNEAGNKLQRSMHALGDKLQACVSALKQPLSAVTGQHNSFSGIQEAVDAVNSSIAQHTAWASELSEEYQPVAALLRKAALDLLQRRMQQSVNLERLVSSHADAQRVVQLGDAPDKAVLEKLQVVLDQLVEADERANDAKYQLDKDHRLHRDDSASKAALRQAKREVLMHEQQLEELWQQIYKLASRGFPDLPWRAMKLTRERQYSNLRYLGHLDASSADLLAPARSLVMYDNVEAISVVTQQQSRHNVYRADCNGRRVCLKQFDLGPVGDTLRDNMRKFQRELVSLSRLVHDNLIKAHLFFIEVDRYSRLNAYVEYPYYPLGDMGAWMAAAQPDAPRIKIVLLGALRGLEHCESTYATHSMSKCLCDEYAKVYD